MKVLVACEESQRVCMAFREKGHEAYSCDIIKCSGGHPEWHILMDAKAVLNGGRMRLQTMEYIDVDKWDMIIAHPPCTYLTNAATRSHSLKYTPLNWINARTYNRIDAMQFFMQCITANCDTIAVENPIGIMNTAYRKPDQIIDPYMFALSEDEKVTKATCLWLKNLEPLKPIYTEKPDNGAIFGYNPSGKARDWTSMITKNRASERSKTFPGIAKAMADQWG